MQTLFEHARGRDVVSVAVCVDGGDEVQAEALHLGKTIKKEKNIKFIFSQGGKYLVNGSGRYFIEVFGYCTRFHLFWGGEIR